MPNRPSSVDLDAVRAAFPKLGLAFYAYEPGGPVTLEVHAADGQTFPFTGPTFASVLARAFPTLALPDPPPAPIPEPTNSHEPQPTPSVFD